MILRSGRSAVFCSVLLLVACTDDDDQSVIADAGQEEACRSIPLSAGNASFEFDIEALSLRIDHGTSEIRYETFEYASAQDFLEESGSVGLPAWSFHEDVSEGPVISTYPEYDDQGRLAGKFIENSDVGMDYETEVLVDTWDAQGRPIRAFVAYYESSESMDRETLVCDSVMREYEYGDGTDVVVRRDTAGNDPRDGSACGGPETVRISYAFYPYWKSLQEEWDQDVADPDQVEPDRVYFENRSGITEVQDICF